MKDQFLLTFEDGLPRGTAQQKRFNSKTGHYFKDSKLETLEKEFFYSLKPHRPKEPSEAPIKLNIWFSFDIKGPQRVWGTWKTTKPDIDNYVKAFIDQMVKVGFFADDSQIVDLHISKTYSEKGSIFVRWEELGDRP